MTPLHRRAALGTLLAAAGWALPGCARTGGLHIGLLAGLAGRGAGLGEAGRNGVMLAVEQRNHVGGVRGRPVRLKVEDDGQNPGQAQAALRLLQGAGVDVVIGPFTSAMASAVLPLAEESGLLLVSPTVTAMSLHGKDDPLIRINRTTRDNASDYAQVLRRAGLRRAAVAFDLDNRSFSLSWLEEFRRAHAAAGGQVLEPLAFESGTDPGFGALAEALLAPQPDVVVLIANAVDGARLAQRLRQLAPKMPLAVAEWAATDTLIELGGRSIDGLMVLQPHDRDDRSPRFTAFLDDYQRRFGSEPSYGAVAAHDAATVVMDAAERRQDGQSLKAALLAHGPFQGLQQTITFDRFGDTTRKVVFTEVRDGRFRPLP